MAAARGEVVGADDAGTALDAALAADMACRRELGDVAVLVERGKARQAADLAEAAGIEQPVDALAAGELAAVALAHHAGIGRAGRQPLVGDRLQGRDLVEHRRPAFVRRCRGTVLVAPAAGLITARIWLPSTASPTDSDANVATMPEQGAATEVSIFMALTTNSRSPAFTSAPSRALMSTIDPACGLSMASCPGGTGKGGRWGAPAPRPRPRLATCWSRNCSAPVFAFAGSIASASSVVRALPARNSGCARIARSWSPLVGTPTMWNSSSARRVRSTAESKQPEEPDWQISLASSGSNCGGGASRHSRRHRRARRGRTARDRR